MNNNFQCKSFEARLKTTILSRKQVKVMFLCLVKILLRLPFHMFDDKLIVDQGGE